MSEGMFSDQTVTILTDEMNPTLEHAAASFKKYGGTVHLVAPEISGRSDLTYTRHDVDLTDLPGIEQVVQSTEASVFVSAVQGWKNIPDTYLPMSFGAAFAGAKGVLPRMIEEKSGVFLAQGAPHDTNSLESLAFSRVASATTLGLVRSLITDYGIKNVWSRYCHPFNTDDAEAAGHALAHLANPHANPGEGVFSTAFDLQNELRPARYEPSGELSGAVVITGGGSGIGKAMAKKFKQEGWTVVILDYNVKNGTAVSNELQVDFIECDMKKSEQVHAALEQVKNTYGIRVMINNAGKGNASEAIETNYNMLSDIFAVNVTGVYNGTIAAIERMGGKGVIMATGSAVSFISMDGRAEYVPSKHGVLPIIDMANTIPSIRGITICPGRVETEFVSGPGGLIYSNRYDNPEQGLAHLGATAGSAGRMIQPDELARAVYQHVLPGAATRGHFAYGSFNNGINYSDIARKTKE